MISSGSSWSASVVSLSSLFSVSVSSFLASESLESSLESSLIGSSSSSNSKTSLALDFLDSLLDFLDWLDLKSALAFSYSLQTFLSKSGSLPKYLLRISLKDNSGSFKT